MTDFVLTTEMKMRLDIVELQSVAIGKINMGQVREVACGSPDFARLYLSASAAGMVRGIIQDLAKTIGNRAAYYLLQQEADRMAGKTINQESGL